MFAGDVSYQLFVRVDHMRRHTISSLLFSLAQKALREEQTGAAWEQVHCHLTGDGDYSGIAVVDEGRQPMAEDDISSGTSRSDRALDDGSASLTVGAADRIRNGEEQDSNEAERLRKIEAFKQAEAQRLADLRAAREASE